MNGHMPTGKIVLLNGAPRSGKSSIVGAIQETAPETWINLGVDACNRMIPERYRPGIGLRPGGERPDLEPFVVASYKALFGSIAAHAQAGLNVVADLGMHDNYSKPLGILSMCAQSLSQLPAFLVGIRCPIDVIMQRRELEFVGREGLYAKREADGSIPPPVLLWQQAVQDPGIYDLDIDTSEQPPQECAKLILDYLRVDRSEPRALERIRISNKKCLQVHDGSRDELASIIGKLIEAI